MDVEIFSLTGKNSADLSQTSGEIAKKLEQNGFSVTKVKSVSPSYSKIISALNELAKSEKAPDQVVIAEALTTKDSTSFRKKFAEVVAASEKYENTPVPKDYWRKRNLDFLNAKKRKADKEEMEQLKDKYRMFRKKSRVFSLKDMGSGYRGYCFMYRGIQVAVLPRIWCALLVSARGLILKIRRRIIRTVSAIRNLYLQKQALSTTIFLCAVTEQRRLHENVL